MRPRRASARPQGPLLFLLLLLAGLLLGGGCEAVPHPCTTRTPDRVMEEGDTATLTFEWNCLEGVQRVRCQALDEPTPLPPSDGAVLEDAGVSTQGSVCTCLIDGQVVRDDEDLPRSFQTELSVAELAAAVPDAGITPGGDLSEARLIEIVNEGCRWNIPF